MSSLIKNDSHISNIVNNMVDSVWYDLISTLVKHWRPETHTFHLSCGECTVTLEDVALQLGLPIDRSAITGVSTIAESAAICYSLLGVSPTLSSNFRMTFLASVRHQAYVFSPMNRWSFYLGIGRSYTFPIYRLMIEQHTMEELTVVPPHIHWLGTYEPILDIEAKPELEPEPEPEPKPEPEQLHTHFADSSYHSELRVNDYFPSLSRHRYHFGFNIFSPVPPQYSTPIGSSSSIVFRENNFSFMFHTPPPTTEEDVDCRDHPQHEHRPPQKYTPRATPSNHQF
ncbi:hypothetical protein PVK06_028747 [Gossypium arboreum]|uniref:Aminotransferase-like plant mobile domain-containing protein n=1 Tax=Gossypium arboreum TaxID=29729 RepID=A0ABR0P4P3_GOSAR|nr:hypothetical protein PVK06_028747 [Gossypium arboreum]